VASLTPTDTFPPSAPDGLRAVVGEGTVELSWSASPESDTAGYHVYRSSASGTPVRLTSAPLATPAFSDRNVQSGARYAYNVSAVDEKGNESPHSTSLEVTIP
jgi:fibronectin type 3 domain-containing protein